MPTVTQPLRDEHKELLPEVEILRKAGDLVGAGSPAELKTAVDEAVRFLTHHLIPHATAEDQALYPVVARVIGGPKATGTMIRDHVEVVRLTGQLQAHAGAFARGAAVVPEDLRRVLYGLYAIVPLHFAKEEEVYLPLLDAALSQREAEEMFEAMEKAAEAAKASAGAS